MLWQILLQRFLLLYTTWRSLMFCNERRSILLMPSVSYSQPDLPIYPWSLEVIGQTNWLSRVKRETIPRKVAVEGNGDSENDSIFTLNKSRWFVSVVSLQCALTCCNCFPVLRWRRLCFWSHKDSRGFCNISFHFTNLCVPQGNLFLNSVDFLHCFQLLSWLFLPSPRNSNLCFFRPR